MSDGLKSALRQAAIERSDVLSLSKGRNERVNRYMNQTWGDFDVDWE